MIRTSLFVYLPVRLTKLFRIVSIAPTLRPFMETVLVLRTFRFGVAKVIPQDVKNQIR